MLIERYVLNMVVILLLAAQSKFCAFIQLVSVALSRDVHVDEVLTQVLVLGNLLEKLCVKLHVRPT